jgi:hypothetical protein
MVIFSEKVFWYIQGNSIGELILFYSFPVYACLWALDRFRVRRIAPLILIAAMFGFLVEGVLTPVLYEAGLLDPVMPAYFVGWHGLLSVVFGWYLLHIWLVEGRWRRVLAAGGLMGVFWGIWSLPYRLPESIAEFEALVQQGESFIPGAWPVLDYMLYVYVFTLVLAAAHWVLSRIWLTSFQPGRIELSLVGLVLIALFGFTVIPVVPLGIVKLAFLFGLIYLGLRANQKQTNVNSLLVDLTGTIRFGHLLSLLSIPAMASLVYAGGALLQPSDPLLRILYQTIATLQALIGAIVFIWALITCLRKP